MRSAVISALRRALAVGAGPAVAMPAFAPAPPPPEPATPGFAEAPVAFAPPALSMPPPMQRNLGLVPRTPPRPLPVFDRAPEDHPLGRAVAQILDDIVPDAPEVAAEPDAPEQDGEPADDSAVTLP